MGRLILIPPNADLIEEVHSHLHGRGRDYSSSIVVFPGRRPSHFLRRAIAGMGKKGFIPPRIFSMDDFVDFLYEEVHGITRRKIETIDAVAILYEIHRASPSPIGGDAFLPPETFLPIGAKVFRDIEEFYIEAVPPERVKEIEHMTEEMLPPQSIKRLQSLSHLYEEFYRRVDETGLSTRSIRYRAVSGQVDISGLEDKKVIIAGLAALTVSEVGILGRLKSRNDTTFIFQDTPGIREMLGKAGLDSHIEEDHGNNPLDNRQPSLFFYSSPDTHGQVLALSGILKERLNTDAPNWDTRKVCRDAMNGVSTLECNDTAIVLPSAETLLPVLHHCLCLFDEGEYNITMGYPIQRTPISGFFHILFELILSMDKDRLYLPGYLKFVLHPYVKNIYFTHYSSDGKYHQGRSGITRIIFHVMEGWFEKRGMEIFLTLNDIENNRELLNEVVRTLSEGGEAVGADEIRMHLNEIHSSTIKPLLHFRDVADFAEKVSSVLMYIYERSTARLHPFFHPFAETFLNALQGAARSLFGRISFDSNRGYFNFLKRHISKCNSPFEGTPLRGIQVMGFLETRNLKFRRVFFLDLNEGIVPDTAIEDSILPHRAREILGLPTYRDRERLITHYFNSLLGGAEEFYIFYVENDRKERSRFVERLLWEAEKKAVSRQWSTVSGQEATDEGLIRSVRYNIRLENRRPEPVCKAEEILQHLGSMTYSASALDRYLKCPLRFYYSDVLRLKERKSPYGEMDRYEIGSLVHRILSVYFSKQRGYALKSEGLDISGMEEVVEGEFERIYGGDLAGRPYLVREQVKKRLRDYLRGYYIPLTMREQVIIRNTEERISLTIKSPYPGLQPPLLNIKGTIDLIEERGGKTHIIDYKISSSNNKLKIYFKRLDLKDRRTWGEHIGSLQIPFYMLLYRERYGAASEGLEGMYLLLGMERLDGNIESSVFDPEEKAGQFSLMENIIYSLIHEISDPKIPFGPSENMKDNCPGCAFQNICGTQWIRGRTY